MAGREGGGGEGALIQPLSLIKGPSRPPPMIGPLVCGTGTHPRLLWLIPGIGLTLAGARPKPCKCCVCGAPFEVECLFGIRVGMTCPGCSSATFGELIPSCQRTCRFWETRDICRVLFMRLILWRGLPLNFALEPAQLAVSSTGKWGEGTNKLTPVRFFGPLERNHRFLDPAAGWTP